MKFLNYLSEIDREQYINLAKQKQFQKLLSYDISALRKGEDVEGMYVETNLDAQSIYSYIGILAEYYEIENDIEIQLENI